MLPMEAIETDDTVIGSLGRVLYLKSGGDR
jgi:hypothetical protein